MEWLIKTKANDSFFYISTREKMYTQKIFSMTSTRKLYLHSSIWREVENNKYDMCVCDFISISIGVDLLNVDIERKTKKKRKRLVYVELWVNLIVNEYYIHSCTSIVNKLNNPAEFYLLALSYKWVWMQDNTKKKKTKPNALTGVTWFIYSIHNVKSNALMFCSQKKKQELKA